MDKSEGKDWLAKTLNNVTEETAKVYKISRLKLEIGAMKKTYNEKMDKIGRKLIELIKDGTVSAELFNPEYENIIQTSRRIEEMENEIEAVKNNLKIGFNKKKDDKERQETAKKDGDSDNKENSGEKE